MEMLRNRTKEIRIGNVWIGGSHPVANPVYDKYKDRGRGIYSCTDSCSGKGRMRDYPLCSSEYGSSTRLYKRLRNRSIFHWLQIYILIIVLRSLQLKTVQIKSVSIRGISVEKRIFVSGRNSKEISCTDPRWCKQRIIGETTC